MPRSVLFAVAMGISALSACTWVDGPTYEDKIACLDLDGDGAPSGACDNAEYDVYELGQDCNDDPALGGADETPGNEELPYDGLDNDCSFTGVGTPHDLIDIDGDGAPGITFAEWTALIEARGGNFATTFEWPAALSKEASGVDCDDNNAEVNPSELEVWYDGVDSDCDGLDDFDEDRDGYIPTEYASAYATFSDASWFTDLPDGDCDDQREDVNPGMTTDDWYDQVDRNCDGVNDFDRDGDGYIRPGDKNKCETFNLKYGYEVSCDLGYIPPGESDGIGDCNDTDASVYPEPTDQTRHPGIPRALMDVAYDGVDKDCRNDDDFDYDLDGYIDNAVADQYPNFSGERWYKNLPAGDCNDVRADIRPGELELVGDEWDQDCDGDIDTTFLNFGDYTVKDPRPPVVAVNNNQYLLGIAATEFYAGGVRPVPCSSPGTPNGCNDLFLNGGRVLKFPFGSGWMAEPDPTVETFHKLSTPLPLSGGFDMLAAGDQFYVAYAYYDDENSKNRLLIKEFDTNNDGGNYTPRIQNGAQDATEPSGDVDLQRVPGKSTYWAATARTDGIQFMSVSSNSQEFKLRGDSFRATGDDDGDGSTPEVPIEVNGTLALDFGETSGIYVNGFTDVNVSYDLREGGGEILPIAPRWDLPGLEQANERNGIYALSVGPDGLIISDGDQSYEHLTASTTEEKLNYNVLSAEAMVDDGVLYVIAIVEDIDPDDDDDLDDIVFAYGPIDGTLDDTFWSFQGTDEIAEPRHASIVVDRDRVFVAVSGESTEGSLDAVGWGFMQTTP